nr:replication protein A 70 kDa DNA-binding subunit [Tanacetum cinerariifolium]
MCNGEEGPSFEIQQYTILQSKKCESSAAAVSKRIPYCNMDLLPYSQANALESGNESHTIAQDSSFVSSYKRGRLCWILNLHLSLCLQRMEADVFETGIESHTTAQNSSFVSGHNVGQVVLDFASLAVLIPLTDGRWSCEHCKAKFWYGEHLKGYSKDQQSHYHKCCSRGKVVLEEEREPPEYIKQLFGDLRLFRTARDKCNGQQILDFKIRLYSVVGAKKYDLPTSQTLGAIVFENGQITETDYDVIIESKNGFS